MMLKIVTIFLVFIALLAMFGRLRVLLPRNMRGLAQKCAGCGRYRIGKGPCTCGRS